MAHKPPDDVLGVILAGGSSTRMGTEKALMPLAGRPMLAHVIARLTPQVPRLILSANGDAARFAAFGLPVVTDALPGGLGPLAGLHAAMTWAAAHAPSTRALMTVPADTPFIPRDLVERLGAATARIAVARSATGRHPPVALWTVDLAADLGRFLASGRKPKVSAFAEAYGPAPVFFGDAQQRDGVTLDPFFNVNTLDDAARAASFLAQSEASTAT